MGRCLNFKGDGTSKLCTLTCRLAGMKLDKGNLQSGEPLEAEEGPSHHVCAGPFRSTREANPMLATNERPIAWVRIATWLILPVVIRSSQRLSHACLSITIIQENCERLIISVIVSLIVPYYLDTCSNSRANTCINTRLLEG